MSRTLGPLAALVMIALFSAACSSVPADRGGSDGTKTSPTQGKAVRFSECMRDHGVGGFPDPDASGRWTVDGVVNGSSLDPDSAAWKKAIAACKDLQPPGFTGHRRSASQQKAALEFAQCVRDNGVKDFPDPDPDGALIDTDRIPSAAGKGAKDIPGLDAAGHKCGAIYAGKLGLKIP